jgi:hypothetical protein
VYVAIGFVALCGSPAVEKRRSAANANLVGIRGPPMGSLQEREVVWLERRLEKVVRALNGLQG